MDIIQENQGRYIRFLAEQIMENILLETGHLLKTIDIWNRIPLNIKRSVSIKIFKRKLKHFLLSQSSDSIVNKYSSAV